MSIDDPALATKPAANISIPRWVTVSCLVVILGFAAFIRIRLLEMPLERDEGEYAYAGQLMLQGIPPYKLAYNMKLPGTYAAYALIMAAFGETIRGIHIGLILVNSVTTILLYFLGRRLFGQICGLVAAAVFALLSLSPSVLGLAAHATHFVTLFAVAGSLVLLRCLESKSLGPVFWSGLLFGLAFVMKQQGVFFGLFGGAILAWHELTRKPVEVHAGRRLITFAVAAILPFTLTCAALAAAGVFPKFWFWTFTYASRYASIVPLNRGFRNFCNEALTLLRAAPLVWALFAVGLLLIWVLASNRRNVILLFGLLVASFATACPGLYFREHYFIPLLPFIGLIVGAAVQALISQDKSAKRRIRDAILPTLIVLVALGQFLNRDRDIFFTSSPDAAVQRIYGDNPFAESPQIARYIQDHSSPSTRIAILGSEPQIYFYSHRLSATGYIYTYPLMEPHPFAGSMQQEMIGEIEAARPEFIVSVNIRPSWLPRPTSDRSIFKWFESFGPKNYECVGLIDTGLEHSIYRWDEKAVAFRPRSESYIQVFKRKDLF